MNYLCGRIFDLLQASHKQLTYVQIWHLHCLLQFESSCFKICRLCWKQEHFMPEKNGRNSLSSDERIYFYYQLLIALSFRPPSRNLIRVIRRRSRIKSGMRDQVRNEVISHGSLLLSFGQPSRNLIRVIRRRSRVKPGMRGSSPGWGNQVRNEVISHGSLLR